MGRFYKTVDFNSEDFMSKLPFEFMAQALQNIDTQGDLQDSELKLLGDATAKVTALDKDKEFAKTIIDDYNNKVADLSTKIAQDRVNWRKYSGEIKNLSREVQSNMTKGDLANVSKNYTAYQTWLTEQKKNNKVLPGQVSAASQTFLNNYEGLAKNKEATLGTEDLYDYVDVQKKALDIVKDIKPLEGSITKDRPMGLYMIKEGESWKTVPPEYIEATLKNALGGDAEVQGFLNQAKKTGFIPDTENYLKNILCC